MIINRLSLYNFGVYAGINVFEFNSNKPIILIGGLNGRGKTTFLEAILLALYGKNSFAYSENKGQTYGQYLRSYVNASDGTNEAYVDLSFFMDVDGTEEYRIKREWNNNTVRTTERVAVYKDGTFNQFLTDNWAMFMENVLPSGLASFFFFDGEKIATLAGESTSAQMKESIKALLGITVLDHLENDLGRVVSRIAKNNVDQAEADELEMLRRKKDDAINTLRKLDIEIEKLVDRISSVQKALDKVNEEYVVKGGDIVNQRQDMIGKRNELKAKIASMQDDLLVASASELPLLLVKNLLVNIREKSEIEQEHKTFNVALKRMQKELGEFTEVTGISSVDIETFLEYFEKKNERKMFLHELNLSDVALAQLQLLLDQRLLDRKISTINLQKDMQLLSNEADQIDSYLSVDIDEKSIASLYKRIRKLEQEKTDIEADVELLQEKRRNANNVSISSTAEFNRKVESYIKKVELNDDGERIIKYANMATAIISKYRVALQESKVSEVATTMTQCYKLLASKKSLIDRIDMDPVSLDMIYLNDAGESIPRKSLSAGEMQMMVIALLWSLAICSKKRLPVIIDTPLSRLDSIHRQALIKVYFPKASDQTIILSTDSEIDQTYYNMMKNDIGDEFTLVYDENTKSTSIKRGYFVEEKE